MTQSSAPERTPEPLTVPPSTDRSVTAARILLGFVDNAGSPGSYSHGEAVGATALWAAMLGLSDDPDRAIGLARAHVAAGQLGLNKSGDPQ